MMEWRDEGVILAVRKHQETAAIVELLTAGHGRHAGVVRGGISRKMTPHLQPGNRVDVVWQARLEDRLGTFKLEVTQARAATLMGSRRQLAGLGAVTALCQALLAEREPQGALYRATSVALEVMAQDGPWPPVYVRWEVALAEALGYPLDLSECAATGATEDLVFVSPKSGRAVSRSGGQGWEDRLLPLPGFLVGRTESASVQVAEGLHLTGHLLKKAAAQGRHPDLPAARARLVALLS
ncbi:MAG: DNA repair protein RecO [Pseudomonadota bacterium]